MGLKISESGILESRYLKIKPWGVISYISQTIHGKKRKIKFHEIDRVLMSKNNRLSFQAKGDVFTIQTNPSKKKHRKVIDELLRCVRIAS
ncbi:MAG: hypothetical protein GY859_21435 [Desulfobacterales bacterium]|nr:hypothetical protein [Desulfobacterales bacterium]